MKELSIVKSKYLRISPTKLQPLINEIRKKTYLEALNVLKLCPQKKGIIIWKALNSAVANILNRKKVEKENLFIEEIYTNLGSKLKRTRPRARGRAFAIEKKYSHLLIKLSEI